MFRLSTDNIYSLRLGDGIVGKIMLGTNLVFPNYLTYIGSKVSAYPSYDIFHDVYVNPAGTKMFALTDDASYGATTVCQWRLTTAFDITTAVHEDYESVIYQSDAIEFNGDGTILYNLNGSDLYIYSLPTAWTVAGKTALTTIALGTSFLDMTFADNGNKVYFCTSNTIYYYTLSTAYDVSTKTLQSTKAISIGKTDMSFQPSSDGTYALLSGSMGDGTSLDLYKMDFGTAYDISTISNPFRISTLSEVYRGWAVFLTNEDSVFASGDAYVYQYGLEQ